MIIHLCKKQEKNYTNVINPDYRQNNDYLCIRISGKYREMRWIGTME